MIAGLVLIILTGLIWMATGCVVSIVSARGCSYDLVQGLGYMLLAAGCALGMIFLPRAGVSAGVMAAAALCTTLSGIFNYFSYSLASKAMALGPNGLVWGIVQAGLVGTFLMGIVCFGEKASWERLTGIALILIGVFTISASRDGGGGKYSPGWKWRTLAAFLLVAATQAANALPSFMPEAAACGIVYRTLFGCVGNVLAFLGFSLPRLESKKALLQPAILKYAAILLALLLANSACLLSGMDLLAAHGTGSIGIPVAGGTSIASFALYSMIFRRERPGRLSLAGLLAVISGCGVIAL